MWRTSRRGERLCSFVTFAAAYSPRSQRLLEFRSAHRGHEGEPQCWPLGHVPDKGFTVCSSSVFSDTVTMVMVSWSCFVDVRFRSSCTSDPFLSPIQPAMLQRRATRDIAWQNSRNLSLCISFTWWMCDLPCRGNYPSPVDDDMDRGKDAKCKS